MVLQSTTYQGILKNPNLAALQQSQIAYFNSNTPDGKQLIAVGARSQYRLQHLGNALAVLQQATEQKGNFLFGYMSYSLKSEIEQIAPDEHNNLGFPVFHFWEPEVVFVWYNNQSKTTAYCTPATEITAVDMIWQQLNEKNSIENEETGVRLLPRISKQAYTHTFQELQKQIQLGNVYELNYCQEFYAENADLSPVQVHKKLNTLTEAPYSAYVRDGDLYAICASPERYIKRHGHTLLTSPIKGTVARHEDSTIDLQEQEKLSASLKESTENVMIVDLVRNDLAKIAKKGSVQVDELNNVYSFKTVHQLISTISCQLHENANFVDIVRATFPMGSMTGAPKIAAMQLAQVHEAFSRGLYSGSIGYIDPTGDFEFNVVIRSLLYNAKKKYISCAVGSAITAMANAEDEYNECLLKAKAMQQAVQ